MAKSSVLSKEYVSDSDNEVDTGDNVQNVPEFTVPNDFKKLKHLKNFDLDNEKDNEVWLFQLPKDLDLSSLKSIPVEFNGEKTTLVLNNKTFDVELDELQSKDNSHLSLLVPQKNNDSKLKPFGKKFKRVIKINEVRNIPKIDYDKVRVPRENVPKIEGLIMRHFATGYDAKDFGVGETAKSSTKKRSHEETVEKESKKNKEDDKNDKKEKKSKKSKKEKKDKKDKKSKKH